jgi:hypothetical protein
VNDHDPGNRVRYPDHILWQGEKFGKLLAAAAVPLLLLPLDMAELGGDLGLPQGVMAGLALPLAAIPVTGYHLYKHRRLAIGAHGMTLYGIRRNSRVEWHEVAALAVRLRLGTGEAPSSVTLIVRRRDGRTVKHLLNFVAAPALPYFAKDIRDAAASIGVPFEVKGSGAARRAFEALDAREPVHGGAGPGFAAAHGAPGPYGAPPAPGHGSRPPGYDPRFPAGSPAPSYGAWPAAPGPYPPAPGAHPPAAGDRPPGYGGQPQAPGAPAPYSPGQPYPGHQAPEGWPPHGR